MDLKRELTVLKKTYLTETSVKEKLYLYTTSTVLPEYWFLSTVSPRDESSSTVTVFPVSGDIRIKSRSFSLPLLCRVKITVRYDNVLLILFRFEN